MTNWLYNNFFIFRGHFGCCPLLEEDVDDVAGDFLDLIDHVRMTGTLYTEELGSGVQSTGPWYNPAREEREQRRELERCYDEALEHQRPQWSKRPMVFDTEVEVSWNEAQKLRERQLRAELGT
jgi:hypothetical protein